MAAGEEGALDAVSDGPVGDWAERYRREGWALLPMAAPLASLAAIDAGLAIAIAAGAIAHGMRDVLSRCDAARDLARDLRPLADQALAGTAILIRGLLLDKTGAANWKVPWHQDLAVAFAARIDAPGFAAWTVKAGVPHAEPPPPLASGRVALRVHLDECPAAAGPLRVLPGSHRQGVLSEGAIAAAVRAGDLIAILAARGDVLVMHPLLVHASSPAARPGRRVLHLEYAAAAVRLPAGLQYAESIGDQPMASSSCRLRGNIPSANA